MPWVRAVATRRARPVLASQAEKARRRTGRAEKLVEERLIDQRERAINSESIIPSRHKRADKRCVRWNASPDRPSTKAVEKEKWMGVIRRLWTLTISV